MGSHCLLPASQPGQPPAPGPLEYPAVPADPSRLAAVCRSLARWAELAGMASENIAALTQASYEAMANAVEHACSPGGSGTFAVLAARTATGDVLVVVRNQDQQKLAPRQLRSHSRCLDVIRELAHHTTVLIDQFGAPTVCMRWAPHDDHNDSQSDRKADCRALIRTPRIAKRYR